MRKKRVILENHRHVAVLWRHPVQRLAVEQNASAVGRLQPRDQPQRRRLPAARRPDDGQQLPVLRRQVQFPDRADFLPARAAKGLRHILKHESSHA